jgi:uncharacterized protein with NAD-binding domain and iron-sulfur cluster
MIYKKRKIVVSSLFFLILISCYSEEKKYTNGEEIHADFIISNVDEVLENTEQFNDKHIELRGEFQMDMENIYVGYPQIVKRIWLDFNFFQPLVSENDTLSDFKLFKQKGKTVRVRGVLKTDINGHLGGYKAGMTEITSFIVE